MGELHIRREDHEKWGVTLLLEGVFDGATALQLRRSVEKLNVPRLTLDFSRVHSYVDLAVAVLTVGFKNRDVVLCGLPRHQERMFRYFGVPTTGSVSAPGYGNPEELLAG